jgi:hypothetical protein
MAPHSAGVHSKIDGSGVRSGGELETTRFAHDLPQDTIFFIWQGELYGTLEAEGCTTAVGPTG